MRGLRLLNAVALLLLSPPVLARPGSVSALSLPSISYLTLESPALPEEGEEPHVLQFWLRIIPSGPRCEDVDIVLATRRLNSLSNEETLFSSFGRGRRASFTAGWSYNCPPPQGPDNILERTLLISVFAVNSTAPGVSRQIAVNFRQTFPPEILSIHGAAHNLLSVNKELDHPKDDFYPSSPLPVSDAPEFLSEWGLKHTLAVAHEKVKLLERLNDPEKMKAWKIDHGMLPHPVTPITHVDDPPPSQPAEDEDDDEYTPPQHDDDKTAHMTPYTPDQKEHPLVGSPNVPAPTIAPESTAALLSKKLSALLDDQVLVTILGAAVVFFALLALLCFSLLRHRMHVKHEEDNSHRRRWGRRHETVAERLARRFNRRHARVEAFKEWFGAVFGRMFTNEEKRDEHAVQHETHVHVIPAQAHVEVSIENEDQTTMEQELAQFREAAAMVGNLIAAEEGRPRHTIPSQPIPSRHPRRLSIESDGFVSDTETLPTYEELAPNSLAVQDGFRYASDASTIVPSSPSDVDSDAHNSDRLGYDK